MEYSLKHIRSLPAESVNKGIETYTLKKDRGNIAFARGTDLGIFVIPFRVAEGHNFNTPDAGVMLVSG